MERRRSPVDGDATRARLIETAERLFAEQGIGPVSVRLINREAGLGPAAVHYHFSSKQGIVDAVLRRLGDPINDKFIAGAHELLERRGELSACDVIDVWASPIIEALEIDLVRGIRWLKVTTKISGRDSARLWGTGADWRAVLERAFPDAPEGDRMLGWSLASVALPQLLARAPIGNAPNDVAARTKYMAAACDFVVHGLESMVGVRERRRSAVRTKTIRPGR